MKTQIVYVVISTDEDLFLEELWASLFSLRIYHPEAIVKVMVDAPTAKRINEHLSLLAMITEIVTVDVPENYSPMARSRVIKTTIRNIIDGAFLFIDTDTIICHSLKDVDSINSDIAAVPDMHVPMTQHMAKRLISERAKKYFKDDISDSEYYFNSGVLYVADNDSTREFYRRWYDNWLAYFSQSKHAADQPSLIQTDKDFGYLIKKLPDVYNSQIAMSLRYFYEAYIIHFWHMDFIADQSYSPFMGLSIYREIKEANTITPHVEELIRNCKSAFATPTMIVGKPQIDFLFSPTGQAFILLKDKNKTMSKFIGWLSIKIIKYYRAKNKIKRKLNRNKENV